jgi:hypothetical protein
MEMTNKQSTITMGVMMGIVALSFFGLYIAESRMNSLIDEVKRYGFNTSCSGFECEVTPPVNYTRLSTIVYKL